MTDFFNYEILDYKNVIPLLVSIQETPAGPE